MVGSVPSPAALWERPAPVLFAMGFRPFFLAAGLAGVSLMAAWAWLYATEAELDTHYGLVGWHAHEMLFGYTAAVIAGFLLTAAHNWTRVEVIAGWPLAGLVTLWCAGRVAPFVPGLPGWSVAAMDLAFFPALAACLWQTLNGSERRPMFISMMGLFTVANGLIHADALGLAESGAVGQRLALNLIILMMAMIGGWVFPAFTERGLGTTVRRSVLLDRIALGATAAFALVNAAAGDVLAAGGLAAIAAVAHAIRLAGWYNRRIWTNPLLWVLHLGYGWLAVGFALRACVAVEWIAAQPALHAFTAGAIGVLTVGMMARVALGHTGRPLTPARSVTIAFVLLNLAALLRVLITVAPSWAFVLVLGSAILWLIAFVLFGAEYLPILVRPRLDGKPG